VTAKQEYPYRYTMLGADRTEDCCILGSTGNEFVWAVGGFPMSATTATATLPEC
jgi:hypothetical protein